MTILSKIETLIDYAKFGTFFSKKYNGGTGELFFPRSFKTVNQIVKNYDPKLQATAIKGYIQNSGSEYFLSAHTRVEVVDLPLFIGGNTYAGFVNNTALKICKLPKLRNLGYMCFKGSTALEYIELGAITSCDTYAFSGLNNLKTVRVGEGTTGSLFLYECPNLTQECLHKIIENYADMTGSQAPTFHVGGANVLKIDDKHIEMLYRKNIFYQ